MSLSPEQRRILEGLTRAPTLAVSATDMLEYSTLVGRELVHAWDHANGFLLWQITEKGRLALRMRP